MTDPSSNRILLGRIMAAHGIRGEMIVASFAARPEDIAAYGPLSDGAGGRRFALTVVRVGAKGVVARIAGVGDRNAAEALRGTELWVERDRLPAPAAGEYYHADLIGLDAVARDGTPIGRIVAVENFGAGDLLEIRLAGTGRSELVPFTDAFVPSVDIAARRIEVVMPEAAPDDPEDSDVARKRRGTGEAG